MTKCFYCGEDIRTLPFKCNYCQYHYCGTHRLPENHICVGPLISQRQAKPIKQYTFQEISNDRESYSSSEPKVNPKYRYSCFLVIVLVVALSFIYSLDIVQLDYWITQVFGNLLGTVITFGLALILPLMFTKPKDRYRLNLTRSIKKAVVKIVLLVEVLIFLIGIMVAVNYAYEGMGDFVTIFWTFIGLSNLVILGIYLEVKFRYDESSQLALTLKIITFLSIIIKFFNIFMLVLLGSLTSASIISYSSMDSFLEYYWIYCSLFIGFHLGRILSRW